MWAVFCGQIDELPLKNYPKVVQVIGLQANCSGLSVRAIRTRTVRIVKL